MAHALGGSVSGQMANAKFEAFFQRMGAAASIEGLEATPLSSLREAVAFIVAIVGLAGAPSPEALADGCTAALLKADTLLAEGPDPHGLGREEIAAIHLYTQEVMYRPLNRALWSKERGAVKPYWGYIRLLQHGLFKVPKCMAGTIVRGIKNPYEPITEADMLKIATESSVAHPHGGSGEPIIWWGFSSCSTNQQPVMNFLGTSASTVRVLYTIEGGSSARDVRRYSQFQDEDEVLMPFGSAFTVVTASAPAPNLLLVTLRQTHDFVYDPAAEPVAVPQLNPLLVPDNYQPQGGELHGLLDVADDAQADANNDIFTTVCSMVASFCCVMMLVLLVGAAVTRTSAADGATGGSVELQSCGQIEDCVTVRCTNAGIAVCSVCMDGLYSFRHDDKQGRCVSNSRTLAQVGYSDSATGLFALTFFGAVPSDLMRGTLPVPASAALSLAGTGGETIGASFTVMGSLTLTGLDVAGSVSAQGGASVTMSGCGGQLTGLTITDSSLDLTGGPQGLTISGAVLLNQASNIHDLKIGGVTFSGRASLDVQTTSVRMEGCGGTLYGVTARDSSIDIDDTTPITFAGSFRFVRSGAVDLKNKIFDNVDLSITGVPQTGPSPDLSVVVSLVGCDGTLSGLSVEGSSFVMSAGSTVTLAGAVTLTAATVTMDSCDVDLNSVDVQETSWDMTGCQGSMANAEISINSQVDITGGQWSVNNFAVTTGSRVRLYGFSGSFNGMTVDGRKDTGAMGSCDGTMSPRGDGSYCDSWDMATNAALADVSCSIWNSDCAIAGSCCTSSGSTEVCEVSRQHCTGSQSNYNFQCEGEASGCLTITLGSTFTVDNATVASTTFACASRYRGDVCDIVPQTCRSFYATEYGKTRMGLNSCGCNGCGSFACDCDGRARNSANHGGTDGFANLNKPICLASDSTC